MKRTILIASMIWSALANGQNMKLVHRKTGFVVVEFKEGKVAIYDRFLETEMKETGILIPKAMEKEFEGKEFIYLEDPLFEKAFIEVYYPLCIASAAYQWESS